MYLCTSVFRHSFSCSQKQKIFESRNTYEKILDPQNTNDKEFWTHEIPTRKIFAPTKYPRKKNWTYEKSMRKNFRPTKYPRRHDGTRPTRPTIARDALNLAHSLRNHTNVEVFPY